MSSESFQSDNALEESNTPPPSILVIERDPATATLIRDRLSAVGLSVLSAADAQEVAALGNHIAPDLVILDLELPELELHNLVARFVVTPSIPILVTASNRAVDIARLGAPEGTVTILFKPLNDQQLVAQVTSLLRSSMELHSVTEKARNLRLGLTSSREISVAIGILMERHCLSREEAFQRLRNMARSSRRRVNKLAQEVIGANENLNLNGTATDKNPD